MPGQAIAYQPDEALKVEDILPDLELPLPEQKAQMGELRRRIEKALSSLPKHQAPAFAVPLCAWTQQPGTRELRKPRAQVQRMIAAARDALRRTLDAGAPLQRPSRAASGANIGHE